MPNSAKNSLGFYCPVHQLRFHVTGEAVIKCEQGGHAVGYGFPDKSWWEYCCDCSTFWPSEPVNSFLRRSECLVCERPTAKRYVCDNCQVVSIESSALVRRKVHSIESAEGIKPSCPGCSAQAQGVAVEHGCAEIAINFLTLRAICPFCENVISSDVSDKSASPNDQVCTFCGTEKKPGYKFCRRCGKPQADVPQDSKTIAQAAQIGSGPVYTSEPSISQPAPELSHKETSGSVGYEDTEFEVLESEIPSSTIKFAHGSAEVEETYETADELRPKSIKEKTNPDAVTEFIQPPAYLPSWESTLAEAPPKRRVPWIPAAIAVAVTFGVVITVAIVLSGKRAGPKTLPPGPPPVPPAGMVFIRGGEFLMGRDTADEYETPAHKVTLKSFFIDINEVTCGDYEKFVKATNHRAPLGWINGACSPSAVRNPVIGVDWYDAIAYAQWIGKRLPTEEEWEFAARGSDGRIYPWGNDWRRNTANAGDSSSGHVVDVGSYPDGKSLFGVMDMVGNAWEWTASDLRAYPNGRLSEQTPGELKVIRGGFWGSSAPKATTTFRRGWDSRDAPLGYKNTGFRCAKDI